MTNIQRNAAARKLQGAFRRTFVFSNASIPGVKFTPTKMTTQIIRFHVTTNISKIFDSEPKGFSEIIGYMGSQRVASVRWIAGRGWIGGHDDVVRISARRQGQTIVITKDLIEVKGSGNYEPAVLAIVKNGLADKGLLRAKPEFVKFEGRFNINHGIALTSLAAFLQKFGKVKPFQPMEDKVVVFKTKGVTFQFFQNGTVIFGGLKDPKELDVPRQIIKEIARTEGFRRLFFDRVSVLPTANMERKKMMLAGRYALAGLDWTSALEKPPFGFYIRPGTDGRPRFYPWATVRVVGHGVGDDAGPSQTFYTPMKFQKKDALAVAKAFAQVKQPIPAHTLKVFADAGVPIPAYEGPKPAYLLNREGAAASVQDKKKYKGVANRRANSWNATRAGFYIRPGPGKQPYFYEIPKGLAAGRKTVIKAYTDAGRNIPKAVRNLFKIGENVKTDVVAIPGYNEEFRPGLKHVVKMGLNGILRINNRQATRLTKKELIEIARNLNIARVNAKWKPENIRGAIQATVGVKARADKTFDVAINGTQYKLLNNGRVQKTTGTTRTQRDWATMPLTERNAIAKKILPTNLHPEFNATQNSLKFDTLRAFIAGKKGPSPPAPVRAATPPSSTESDSNFNRYALELEYNMRLATNMGNLARNGNQALFMKEYNKLPKGARGKPLKATVNKAYAKFVKETKGLRVSEPARARYIARIAPPNWLPTNKVNAYKKLLTNLAFQKPRPTQKALKESVMTWLKNAVPIGSPQPARNIENVVTGLVRRLPAYNPANRKSPVIPKRTPSPKKSPGTKAANAARRAAEKVVRNAAKTEKAAKKAREFNTKKAYILPKNTNVENLGNAMVAAGLNVSAAHSWNGLVRAGVNAKFKNTWRTHVAKS